MAKAKNKQIKPKVSTPVVASSSKTGATQESSIQGSVGRQSSLFENLSTSKTLLFFVGLVLLVGVIVFREYFLFKKYYIFIDTGSDSYTQIYAELVHFADYLRSDGIPKWSFRQGAGQNVYPMWFDAFNLFPMLSGAKNIPALMFFIEYSKLFLGGLIFFLYLRLLGLHKYVTILGGLLFAYCGYYIVGTWFTRFSDEIVYFPLLLLALELFLQKKSWWLLPIPIALMAMTYPIWVYFSSILILIYGTLRFIELYGWQPKQLLVFFLKTAAICSIGLAISTTLFVSILNQMLNSPRVAGGAGYSDFFASKSVFGLAQQSQYGAILLRFFSNDLFGTSSEYKGWLNYLEAPLHYCGIVTLLLVPQLFHFIGRKQKIMYGVLLGLCAFPLIFPYFRYMFWVFTGDYYRTMSLFLVFVLLFLAMKALTYMIQRNQVNRITLLISFAVLVIVLYLPYGDNVQVDASLRKIIVAFLVAYSLVLLVWKTALIQPLKLFLLLGLVATEIIYQHTSALSKRSSWDTTEFAKRDFFNDYSLEGIDYLKKRDKSFYRIEKDVVISANDSKVQGYFGTIAYHAFNQLNYVKFLGAVGVIDARDETQTRWLKPLIPHFYLHGLMSVNYMLVKGKDANLMRQFGYDSLAKFENMGVYKNYFGLPLGYTYDSYITEEDFTKLDSLQSKHIGLLKAFVVPAKETAKYKGFSRLSRQAADSVKSLSFAAWNDVLNQRRQDTLTVNEFTENHIKGTIDLDKQKLLFFSIPYDTGWAATVDGEDAKPVQVNIGLIGLLLNKGKHTVALNYEPPFFKIGLILSAIGLVLYGVLLIFLRRVV